MPAGNSIKAAPGIPFKKGQSGNPTGRAKKTPEQIELEVQCRNLTPEALKTIVAIMSGGENERNKLSAAQYVLDRGWGKPSQEVTGKDGGPLLGNLVVQFVEAKPVD